MTAPTQVPFQFEMAEHNSCPKCGQPWRGVVTPDGLRLDLLRSIPEREYIEILRCWLGRCGGL